MIIMKSNRFFAILFLSMFLSPTAEAVYQTDTENIVKDEAAHDSLSVAEALLSCVTFPIYTYEEDRTIEASGAGDLPSLLERFVPGVEVTQSAAGTDLHIQGYGVGSGILVLVDGKRQSGMGETFDLSRIPLSSVRRVEIKRGSSVLYGSDAVGMVIDVITEDKSPYLRRIEVEARYDTPARRDMDRHDGSYRRRMDSPQLSAALSARFNRRRFTSDTRLSVRNSDPYLMNGSRTVVAAPLNGLAPFGAGGVMSVDGALNLDAYQHFRIWAHDKVLIKVYGNAYRTERYGFAGAEEHMLPLGYDPDLFEGSWGHTESYGGNGDISVIYDINSRNTVTFDLYGNIDYRRLHDDGTTHLRKSLIFTPSVEWVNRPNEHHTVRAGAEMYMNKLNATGLSGGYGTRHEYNVLSLYGLEEFRTGGLTVTGGLRIDNFGWDNFVNIYTNFVGKPKNMTHASVNPELSVGYEAGDFSVKGKYNLAYIQPSMEQMYAYAYLADGGVLHGTPWLKRQKANNVSVEGRYNGRTIDISVRPYAAMFKNTIALAASGEGLAFVRGNKNRYYGVELRAEAKPLRGWTINASYNYMRKEHEELPVMDNFGYRPHSFVASTRYTINRKKVDYDIFFSASYLGEKDVIAVAPDTSPYIYTLPSRTLLDINISFLIIKRYRLFIGVDNLLDSKPGLVTRYTPVNPGITAHAGFAFRFGR